MSFRFRRSKSLGSFGRINVSKTGVGFSVGGPGARISTHSSGRVTRSARLPGTGLYYRKDTTGGGHTRSRRTGSHHSAPTVEEPIPVPPGCFAPKADKRLHRAALAGDVALLDQVASRHPDHRRLALAIGVAASAGQDPDGAEARARSAVETPWAPAARRLAERSFPHLSFAVELGPGIGAEVPVTDLPEVFLLQRAQERDDTTAALAAAALLPAEAPYRLMQAGALVDAGRFDEVLALSDGVTNTDDESMLLLTVRAEALRRQGLLDAAREVLREVLKNRVRAPEVRRRALLERARTYQAQGQLGRARQDCERIIAEDSTFPGVRDLLAELGG